MGAPGRRSGSPEWTARVCRDSVFSLFKSNSSGSSSPIGRLAGIWLQSASIGSRFKSQFERIGLNMPTRLQSQLGQWSSRPGPLYRRLADALRDGIERGEIEAGERLPPERVLAQHLSVSRTTVVQAYAVLRKDA